MPNIASNLHMHMRPCAQVPAHVTPHMWTCKRISVICRHVQKKLSCYFKNIPQIPSWSETRPLPGPLGLNQWLTHSLICAWNDSAISLSMNFYIQLLLSLNSAIQLYLSHPLLPPSFKYHHPRYMQHLYLTQRSNFQLSPLTWECTSSIHFSLIVYVTGMCLIPMVIMLL